MDFDQEKMNYLLNHVYYYIYDLIDNVLADSQDDPHYSAVTATNMIKCYIEIMSKIEPKLPYSTVKDFFLYSGYYSEEEFEVFEKQQKKRV